MTALAGGSALITCEVEELVFLNGSAGLAAPTVEVKTWIGDFAALNGVFRIQIAVLEILVEHAVNVVGAAANGGVELSAGGVSELRRELIDDGGELAGGIVGHIDQRTGDALVVVVDALNGVVVGFRAETANRRTGSNAKTAA